jgi:hypothetical protein
MLASFDRDVQPQKGVTKAVSEARGAACGQTPNVLSVHW